MCDLISLSLGTVYLLGAKIDLEAIQQVFELGATLLLINYEDLAMPFCLEFLRYARPVLAPILCFTVISCPGQPLLWDVSAEKKRYLLSVSPLVTTHSG